MTPPIEKQRILLVDDAPINLKTLMTILGDDYELSIATNGVDALKAVAAKPPSLILLDIVMPGMDGFEVCTRLKKEVATHDIPIIFVTSSNSPEQEVRGLTLGAVDFLTKPLSTPVVLARVKTHLALFAQAKLLDEKNLGLEKEIGERRRAEEYLLQIQQSRTTIHLLLQTVLEPLSLATQMARALDIILDIPWLAIQRRGAVFLVDEKSGDLLLVAHRNLPDYQLHTSHGLAPGHRLGPRGSGAKKIVFVHFQDERGFEGVPPRGVYLVSIFHGDALLGMLNLYVDEGHIWDLWADELLTDISDTLARIINNRRLEEALATAKRIAEEANQAKSRFLATMSHEIRTPLNGIMGFTQLLAHSELTEKQKQHVEMIQHSGKHLLTVISDILDFSKIEANRLNMEEIPFALDELLEKTVNLVALTTKEKGVELAVDRSPDVPVTLLGDPNRLRQILYNLVSNAVKFTERGRIDLWVKWVADEGESVVLGFGVDDTGIGISSEQLAKLFIPFGQADDSTTRRYGGTGLGLVISSQLVRLMGGNMRATSVPGLGSKFYFTARFKRYHPEQQPPPVEAVTFAPSATDWGEQQLLVVEDDEINGLFITEILQVIGFRHVDVAHNGRLALEQLATHSYDLVLMDCQMPVMDGLEATQEIRRREKSRKDSSHLPVIALTANAMGGDREKCLAVGMDDFLTKPLDVEELKQTLARWLGNRHIPPPPSSPKATSTGQNDAPLHRKEMAELRKMFGEEKFMALLRMMLASLPGKITGIREAVRQQDAEQLHSKTHTLKGNCGMIKAYPMLGICQKLVDLGRSGTTQGAEALLEQLEWEYKRLVVAIGEEMDRLKK